MKALITGAAGFVGKYLINNLCENGVETSATKLPGENAHPGAEWYDLDILDPDEVGKLLDETAPDLVFHLAAQSSVALSWDKPGLTADVNIKGAINLLESVRKLKSRPRVLLIGSGEEYGYVYPDEIPISEDTPLRPGNIYAGTKAAQGIIGQIYLRSYGLDIVAVRAFNHTGPGQSDTFVLSNFCRQAAEIEAGLTEAVIKTGNLEAKRDFTDVRDIVEAYRMLAEKGEGGKVYNVGSGKAVSINEALDHIISLTKIKIDVVRDPVRMRPSDIPVIVADITRMTALTGWKPAFTLGDTLTDMLNYWREKVRNRHE